MSAFGYQGIYNPSWRGQVQAENYFGDPLFNIAPEMQRPNFTPDPTSPIEDPTLHHVGEVRASRSSSNPFDSTYSSGASLYRRDPWANPLAALFGPTSPFSSGAVGPEMGKGFSLGSRDAYASLPRQPVMGYTQPGATMLPGIGSSYQVGTRPVFDFDLLPGKGGEARGPRGLPQNARDLLNQVSTFTLTDLMRLTSGGASLSDKFSDVAQAYANAYANPNYGKRLFGHDPTGFGENPLSQQETTDFLQQAYLATLKRMNDAYML